MKHTLILSLVLLAGCAEQAPVSNAHRADVHCVEQRSTVIIVGADAYVVPGGCIAWEVGPTERERAAFDLQHGSAPSARAPE